MTTECRDGHCAVLKDTMRLAGKPQTNPKLSLLSAEGKILSAIARDEKLIMKDIPHITGISFRSCFDCVRKLTDLGIIEKAKDPDDGCSVVLKLNHEKLCEMLCGGRGAV